MLKILLASQNPHKCREFAQLLSEHQVQAAQPFDCEETAASYLGNALIKARAVQSKHDWVLADDSGLEVFALDMRPGIHSARYGGQELSSAQQNELLLGELAEQTDRRAAFVCCLVLLAPNGQFFAAQASVPGIITREPRSKHEQAFGYDPIFVPGSSDAGKTFAQLDEGVKQQLSHRYQAWCKMRKSLLGLALENS